MMAVGAGPAVAAGSMQQLAAGRNNAANHAQGMPSYLTVDVGVMHEEDGVEAAHVQKELGRARVGVSEVTWNKASSPRSTWYRQAHIAATDGESSWLQDHCTSPRPHLAAVGSLIQPVGPPMVTWILSGCTVSRDDWLAQRPGLVPNSGTARLLPRHVLRGEGWARSGGKEEPNGGSGTAAGHSCLRPQFVGGCTPRLQTEQ